MIGLYYTAVIAWALSFFVFSFDLRWGDDPAGFLFGDYLRVGDPGISFDFVPGVLIPLALVWIAAIVVLGVQDQAASIACPGLRVRPST